MTRPAHVHGSQAAVPPKPCGHDPPPSSLVELQLPQVDHVIRHLHRGCQQAGAALLDVLGINVEVYVAIQHHLHRKRPGRQTSVTLLQTNDRQLTTTDYMQPAARENR